MSERVKETVGVVAEGFSSGDRTLSSDPAPDLSAGGKPVRTVIIDDHELFSISLETWLSRQSEIVLLGRAKDGEEGLALCLRERPDVALIDLSLPKVNGFALMEAVATYASTVAVLIVSGLMDPYTVWRVAQSTAKGYIDKNAEPATLLAAIRALGAGGRCFSAGFQKVHREWLARPASFQKILSDREQAVLQRVVAGWDEGKIAEDLHISLLTVGVHRKNLRRKLSAHNDRDLIAYARVWGLDNLIP